ncbi:MAG: hypothetical protein ABS960_06915 [Solibacillus isronensis]
MIVSQLLWHTNIEFFIGDFIWKNHLYGVEPLLALFDTIIWGFGS